MKGSRFSFYASEEACVILKNAEKINVNRSEFISQLIEKYGHNLVGKHIKQHLKHLSSMESNE